MRKGLRMLGWIALMGAGAITVGCSGSQGGNGAASSPSAAQSPAAIAQEKEQVRQRHPKPELAAQPGVFDFYLMTLSWSPEYCLANPKDAQCGPQPGFVLHGLWPENTNGTYPEECSTAPGPSDPGAYKDIYPDASLLTHEWKEHGTCSGLSPDAFFQLSRKAEQSIKIPANLATKQTPAQEAPTLILASFASANPGDAAGDFALSCGNNRLTAVQVCLDKNLKAMACPAMKSCRANVVKITAPGATSDSAAR